MAAPAKPRRGRPPNPLDPDASSAAALGAELRALRLAKDLTLEALGDLTGYTPQYISEVERAKTPPTQPFFTACDAALDAQGELLALLPAALRERDRDRQERTAARRTASDLAALRCEAHSDAGENVNPTNRRGLIGTAGAAALGAPMLGAAPIRAGEVDPELPAHWDNLLRLLGRLDAMNGPRDVLAAVCRELRIIAQYREGARGELRTELMRVEACWAEFAAWLSNDAGQSARTRVVWIDRAAALAAEAGCPDIAALAKMRRSQWAEQEHDAGRAVAHARDALSVRGASPQTRVLCELRGANTSALMGDAGLCERHIAAAYTLGADSTSPAGWGWGNRRTSVLIRATEARCWLALDPRKAIPLYENVLREWPRDCARSRGLHQARLALACAGIGERDRAEAEGRKALAIAKATGSALAGRELKRLGAALAAA
jgi:transcriptional regulator with XRE-family HTH domain